MSTQSDDFLRDLGSLLKEDALEAKNSASSTVGTSDHAFELGRLTAYYEVVSLMKQQAISFGISEEAISLSGFDPDSELLASNGR